MEAPAEGNPVRIGAMEASRGIDALWQISRFTLGVILKGAELAERLRRAGDPLGEDRERLVTSALLQTPDKKRPTVVQFDNLRARLRDELSEKQPADEME